LKTFASRIRELDRHKYSHTLLPAFSRET
jgi:hypothetical protein